MKIKHIAFLAFVSVLSVLSSCQQEPYMITVKEEYTRSFVKSFGTIDMEQDWNLAQKSKITVDAGQHADNVSVYAKYNGSYYLVADIRNVSGKVEIPIDIPEGCEKLKINLDGRTLYASPNETVKRSAPMSRDGETTYWTHSDHPTPWIMNASDALLFLDELPEMKYNRKNPSVYKDFILSGTGEPMIVYPLFWNSSHVHTLGLYYFDTNVEEEENASTIKYVPIYTNKEGFDSDNNVIESANTHLMIQKIVKGNILQLGWTDAGSTTYKFSWNTGNSQSYGLDFFYNSPQTAYNASYDASTNTLSIDPNCPAVIKSAIESYMVTNNITSTTDLSNDAGAVAGINAILAANPAAAGITVTEITGWSVTFTKTGIFARSGSTLPSSVVTYLSDYLLTHPSITNSVELKNSVDADFITGFNNALRSNSGFEAFSFTQIDAWTDNPTYINLTISEGGGPANGQWGGNQAPDALFNWISAQMSGKSSYSELSGSTFESQLDAKIKEVLGANYSLYSWTPSSDYAELTVSYTGGPANTANINAAVYSYIANLIEEGENYDALYEKSGFLDGLKAVVKANYDGASPQWTSSGTGASIQLSTYTDQWVPANATHSASTTRYNRDGTTLDETLQNIGQTAYDYDYDGLIKSTGIEITVPDGKRFGFYIILDNAETSNGQIYYSEVEGNIERYERYGATATPGGGNLEGYVTPVQEKYLYCVMYQKDFPGTLPDGNNKITYLCFEDWEDSAEASDADLNDLVFAVSGIDVEDDQHFFTRDRQKRDETTLSWLVAVEDLGATDDFDFNDIIFQIQSITTNTRNETETEAGTTQGSLSITKQVVVQALAAGGILEAYLHYNDGIHDYILGPSSAANPKGIVLENTANTDGSNPPSGAEACEWHKWFGVSTSTMVNTNGRNNPNPGMCDISAISNIDFDSFTITNYGTSPSSYDQSVTGGDIRGFYITINTTACAKYIGALQTDSDERALAPSPQGEAPQMFLIPDVGHVAGEGWYWPEERAYISDAYEGFRTWVGNADASGWHLSPKSSSIVTRPAKGKFSNTSHTETESQTQH